jgi:hypothetical protein
MPMLQQRSNLNGVKARLNDNVGQVCDICLLSRYKLLARTTPLLVKG